MEELPPKVAEWSDGGEAAWDMRSVHRSALRRAAAGAPPTRLEMRCPVGGCRYLRLEREVPNRALPYWPWRVFIWWRQLRFLLRAAFVRKCPQCKFDAKVRGW